MVNIVVSLTIILANSTLIRVSCQKIQANKDGRTAIFVDNIFRVFLYIYMASSTISRTALNFDHNIILCNKTYELCKTSQMWPV